MSVGLLRRYLGMVAALLLVVEVAFAAEADFFVAPDGSDANSGTEQTPFATIARARDAVRGLIAKGLTRDVTVVVRGGTYRVTEPIEFGPVDGGSKEFSVTYAAAAGEKPVISGGRRIAGWLVSDLGTWTAQVPEVKAGRFEAVPMVGVLTGTTALIRCKVIWNRSSGFSTFTPLLKIVLEIYLVSWFRSLRWPIIAINNMR